MMMTLEALLVVCVCACVCGGGGEERGVWDVWGRCTWVYMGVCVCMCVCDMCDVQPLVSSPDDDGFGGSTGCVCVYDGGWRGGGGELGVCDIQPLTSCPLCRVTTDCQMMALVAVLVVFVCLCVCVFWIEVFVFVSE